MAASLGNFQVARLDGGGCGQCFHRFDDQVSGEVAAHEADHLVVVQRCDGLVMRRRVEDFLDLLEEGLAVELGGADERVLSEKDVLASQRRIEVLVEQVKGPLVAPLEDNLDRVLQIDAHLVRLEIVLGSLTESVLGTLGLAFKAEDAMGYRGAEC